MLNLSNIIVAPTIEYRRSKIKVLHTTQDIKVSIKLTLFENIPAPLLHTLAEAIVSPTSCLFSVETGFIISRDASRPEIVFVDIQKASTVSVWALTRKNTLEMDSQLTCRRTNSIAFECLLCETL